MDVPGAEKANNDIIYMNEPGMSAVDGAAPPTQSISTNNSGQKPVTDNAGTLSVGLTGTKSDSRNNLTLKKKAVANNKMAIIREKPLNEGSGPKSPVKKIPEVLPAIVLGSHSTEVPNNINKSRNVRFHKLFKSTPVEEYPIESFSCAFKGDILLHGQMYVSHNWVCFYSKIKARGRLIEIPFDKIICITREKLALIIPNAIGIQTADQKFVFGSFISRDSTYKKLVTIWKVNQDAMSCHLDVDLDITDGVLGNSNSGDSESDTTEDDLNADEQLGRVLAGVSGKREVEVIRHQEPSCSVQQVGNQQCLNCKSAFKTFCSFSIKLQKIPRTNMLLAICTILVFFLILSAIGLTYKILLLQSRLEMRNVWSPHLSVSFRDRAMSNLYWLQTESHASVVRQLHSVLEANIHLLEEVHLLLKGLYREPAKSTSKCNSNENL